MSRWSLALPELLIVLAFGVGWAILELHCKRLDRRLDAERRGAAQEKRKPGVASSAGNTNVPG